MEEEGLPCLACKWILSSLGNKNPICLIEYVPYVRAFTHTLWNSEVTALLQRKSRTWGKYQIGHWTNVYAGDM